MSMPHPSLPSVQRQVDHLHRLRDAAGRTSTNFEITACVNDLAGLGAIDAWERAGVDRLIVKPWIRSREAIEGMRRFAADHISPPAQPS